jgi:hypothetical protein
MQGQKRHSHVNQYSQSTAEGNFCDEKENVIGPHIMKHYNLHMVYVDKADRMASSYSIRQLTWKWAKKLFFHLLDTAIQKFNSFFVRWKVNLIQRISDLP